MELLNRKIRSLIEKTRTMLADSLLPTTFWVEVVSTACYVQNRVLVTKPHNKTPYELLLGRPPSISFMRPFGCYVTILNTLDPLGKFDRKAGEGFLVGYSINSKDFRVFNTRTRKVEENMHINFLKNKPNIVGSGTEWLFDIDSLTKSMNYEPVTSSKDAVVDDANEEPAHKGERNGYANSTNRDCIVSPSVSTAGKIFTNTDDLPTDPLILDLEETGIFSGAYDDEDKEDGIFISQNKYVTDILKKFDFVTVKTTSTLIQTNKALLKDEEAEDVDVHLYRSMIRSLMYLTASRPDIIYLKGQPKLGLWYPMDSLFDLESFSDSDYAGASLDRKSTTGGCQFLAKLILAIIQNQMLHYGFNFMNTKIHIDNESTICIVKNSVFHSKTKHIEIRHHFIRDSYEKRLIQVIKIHTDHNVVNLLTKAFDVSSDEFGVKTGSCKVNAARQDLVLMGENDTAEGV
ncbi:putative ribonuclease H-like domain-containing protein [Tanacetum coccineum]|uniref:Ribonuclease H-like domain-containing protein n=1 Tax=Tanacetum coccineum TaxID=301880 RepID=A0ABQ5HI37_9ASTR